MQKNMQTYANKNAHKMRRKTKSMKKRCNQKNLRGQASENK